MALDYHVESGQVSSGITLNSSDTMYVSGGGVATSTTVNNWGHLLISSGGVANETTVSNGSMTIFNGGVANNTVNRGSMTISSGGVANETTVSNGSMTIFNGGVANETTVDYSGYMHISSGGAANNTTVSGGRYGSGYMHISGGGTASSITVKDNGCLYISSGGTALNVTWTPCVGNIVAYEGAIVTYASRYQGVYYGSDNVLASSAMTMSGKTVYGFGAMYIMENGVANETTVDQSCYMYVSSGGVANETTVSGYMYISSGGTAKATIVSGEHPAYSRGGHLTVSNGGVANETTVNEYGTMHITSGGVANSTTVNNRSAWMFISSGGVANSTTVSSGGELYISSGGTATAIKENGGYVGIADGASATFVANSFSGLVLSAEESATIHSGTTANSTTLTNLRATLIIFNGGVASNTTINREGNQYDSGSMTVSSGGTATLTTVNDSGSMTVSNGGVANSTTVNSGGALYILSGGSALDVIWTPCVGHVGAEDGAIVTYVSRYQGVYFGSGDILASSAMTMSGKTVNGSMYVMESGTANSTTVRSGRMFISGGGVANSTTVNEFGRMYISSGGVAHETTVIGGWASMTILSGGVANSTTVNVYGGMHISNGGVANSTTVTSGGYLFVSSGGTLGGALQIDSDAEVSVDTGAVIDFTVAGRSAKDGYLINDLSLINGLHYFGTPDFSITVSTSQAAGSYKLAHGAANFDKTVTVRTTEAKELGTITVGKTVTLAGRSYTLNKVNGDLTLSIGGGGGDDTTPPEKPVASADITETTDGNVTVTAVFSSDSAQKQYSLDGETWSEYSGGVVFSQNGTVYFRGIDAAGNISEATSYTVANIAGGSASDTTPPVRPVASASTTALTSGSVTVSATFSNDSETKEYSLDNRVWQPYTGGVVFTQNGVVYFRGIDAAGNISEATSYTVTNIEKVTPDPVVPVTPVAPTGLTAKVSGYDVVLSWEKFAAPKGVDVAYEVMVDGKAYETKKTRFTAENMYLGVHSFAVRTVVAMWNFSNWSGAVEATIADVTPPKAGAAKLTQTGAGSVHLAWNPANDNIGIDHYVVTCGGQTRTLSGTTLSADFTGLAANKVDATVVAVDAAGNVSKAAKKSIKLKDVTAPTQAAGLAAQGVVNNKSGGVLTWKASTDNVGVTQYLVTVDGKKTYKSKTNSVKIKKLAAGEHTFTVVAVDKAKNRSAVGEAGVFEVKDVIAPKVKKLSAKVAGSSAMVTWKAIDESKFDRVELSIGGTVVNVSTAGIGSCEVGDLAVGVNRLRLEAYDLAGNMAYKEVSVKVKAPKVAPVLAAVA